MMKRPTISSSMIRKLVGTALVGLMAVPFLAGCREKDKPKAGSLIPNYARRDGFGCVQGVIMNGFTGQRFDLSTMKEPDGIYALIRGQKLRAQFHRDDPNLKGEYYICDIPLETTIPVFANITGFLPFESILFIESSRPIRVATDRDGKLANNNVSEEVPVVDPIVMANVRLYPKQNGTRDLVINVRESGQAVANAMVDLQPVAPAFGMDENYFLADGFFVNTSGARLVLTRKTTGADGVATFAASEIAYGGRYKLKVTPAAAPDVDLGTHSRTFTLGIDNGTPSVDNDRNNWEFNIDLSDTNKALKVVACSATAKSWNESGTITMVLNRPVKLSAGSGQADDWKAVLSGGSAVLKADSSTPPANNASETVDVTISGDGKILTLALKADAFTTLRKTPDYTKVQGDAQNVDVGLSVTYTITGIMLDVIDSDAVNFNNIALSTVTGANSCKSTRFYQEYK